MLKDDIKISNLHHKEHMDWLQQLDFYQEQIGFFQQELLLTLHRHPKYWSIVEHVHEYRNIFIKKLQRIDDLKHEIILLEKQLTEHLHAEDTPAPDEQKIRGKMDKFVTKFEDLKKNFRSFVAKNS